MELLDQNASSVKLFRQAKRILKTTSRASEPAWYQEANELNLQWHLWVGPKTAASAIYSRSLKQWWEGPDLPPVSFEKDETGSRAGIDTQSRGALHEILRQILSSKEYGAKPKSLGIIIHLADGVRIRELAPDFAADDDFDTLNELLISAPDVALGDDTVSNTDGRWRLLPLLGIPDGDKRSLAVQVSSMLLPFVTEFRNYGEMRNIPVIVNTRSAQLEALSGISYLLPEIQAAGAGSTLALIQYESMTLLFAIGNRGDLQLVRPLMHRGSTHLTASETHDVISKTAALLNIKDPNLVLVSLAGMSEQDLIASLSTYLEQFPEARFKCIDTHNVPLTEGVPARRLEFAVSVQDSPPVAEEAPFQKELRSRWTNQDFYGPSLEERLKMPTRSDLRLLKFSNITQKIAMACILAFAGWTGMDFIVKMRSEAWGLGPDAAQEMEVNLAKLQKERTEWQHWDKLLEKRSEGWLAMEALLELFPDNGGVILRSANYRAETGDVKTGENTVGLKRAWEIAGFANPEVATQLPTLGSRTRVAELLNQIAQNNHAPYLAVNSTSRELQVTLQQKQGTMPASFEFPAKVARHFRTSFELSIIQSLNSKDELAINTSPLKSE